MRSMQYLNSKHRIGIASALRKHGPDTPEDRPAANVHEALDRLARIVADPCYTDPDGLTQDRITAYALALIRLRECA
ncbi:MAG: hypothetical protein Q8M46_02190, partial [Thiobacillus sp.]|nr:hypothetical protein [Thiobacillus sp.]